MARRLRLGPASSPKVLGVVAAAVLVVALVLTGRLLYGDGGGGLPARPARSVTANTKAPYRAGGKVDCPPAWPVLAMSNHASYPAGHPARPPRDATPVACYQTTAQAAGAGYAPAPLPPGALEVAGVYLTPPSRRFRASCQRVADRLGFAVPCPRLLPTSAPATAPQGLCEGSPACRRGQLLVFARGGFVVPFGYVGAMGGYGTVGIVAMPTRGEPDRRGLRCPAERRIGTPTVHRVPAVLAACPEDPPSVLGGSVLVRWSERVRSWRSARRARAGSTSGWWSPWPTTCTWSRPDADRAPDRPGGFLARHSTPDRVRLDHPNDHPVDRTASVGNRLGRRGIQREQGEPDWRRPVRLEASGS